MYQLVAGRFAILNGEGMNIVVKAENQVEIVAYLEKDEVDSVVDEGEDEVRSTLVEAKDKEVGLIAREEEESGNRKIFCLLLHNC